MQQTTVLIIAATVLGSVFGFTVGNTLDYEFAFHLKEWQTLTSAIVAFIGITVAYLGVRQTQRINVLIKEQDRIDELLPGLRQADDLLALPRSVLNAIRQQHRYQAAVLLDAAFKAEDGESLEDVVRRKFPLADNHLKRELAKIIFALKSQARILEIGHKEVERYQTDVANINTFAPCAREGLLEVTKRVEESYKRENETMGKLILALEAFAASIKQRISKAEARSEIIRNVLDKFFQERS